MTDEFPNVNQEKEKKDELEKKIIEAQTKKIKEIIKNKKAKKVETNIIQMEKEIEDIQKKIKDIEALIKNETNELKIEYLTFAKNLFLMNELELNAKKTEEILKNIKMQDEITTTYFFEHYLTQKLNYLFEYLLLEKKTEKIEQNLIKAGEI